VFASERLGQIAAGILSAQLGTISVCRRNQSGRCCGAFGLSQHLSAHPAGATTAFIEQAVFGIDRWLRQRQGVYEYSSDPFCVFRVQRVQAEGDVLLSDGTRIAAGAPVLNLHLWNEHVPPMRLEGATVAWAREATRRVDRSMRDLARHLKWTRPLDDIVALRGDMRLGTSEQSSQLARLAAHYGFEPAGEDSIDLTSRAVQRFAENVFIFLLVMATNPIALRAPVLRRDHKLVYLSRAALDGRYAGTEKRAGRRGGG